MLTIINPQTNRETNYTRAYLATEARLSAKYAPESDGKARAWSIVVVEGSGVSLRVDYLDRSGIARTTHTAL